MCLNLRGRKMRSPRVLLADDNPDMRDKVLRLLESDFEIVGAVTDGQQAIHSALRLNPDILVTDISMPLANGIQVASHLRHSGSTTKVIVFSMQRHPPCITLSLDTPLSI